MHRSPPTRAAASARLAAFVAHAGRDYAARRNYDLPDQGHPHVSRLSPYIRHRIVTEAEVIAAVLDRHSQAQAEKFLAEVFWRTYWKGWLELRPQVWADYIQGRDRALATTDPDAVLRAETGETDIAAFNGWAHELVNTGYLHNHARMWFASIWIFTLRLPWEVGADFFLRHLLDGDPASNTLSWRWVAGLQTPGKHYLARASNIAKFTEGRENPEWRLNTGAAALSGQPHPVIRPLAPLPDPAQGVRTGLLLTEEDLSPDLSLCGPDVRIVAYAALRSDQERSPRPVSPLVAAFTQDAIADAMGRLPGPQGPITHDIADIVTWAADAGLEQIVTAYAPIGPAAAQLRRLQKALSGHQIAFVQLRRRWDTLSWPHATHGFFRFKAQIPAIICAEGLSKQEAFDFPTNRL